MHRQATLQRETEAEKTKSTKNYRLRRAGESVLVSDAVLRLVCVSLDQVGHRVLGAAAVHDLKTQEC